MLARFTCFQIFRTFMPINFPTRLFVRISCKLFLNTIARYDINGTKNSCIKRLQNDLTKRKLF